MIDAEIVRQVLAGDLQRFRCLVERHHRKVFGMIYNMTRDHHLSEDLCQDVFVDVFRALARYDASRARFSTWVYRIAQNKTLNAIRKKRPVFFSDPPDAPGETNVRREVESNEMHRALDRALSRLPANQRVAFVWAEFEQLSYREIAEIEGTSESAIKSRINRARRFLQDAVRNTAPFPS